MLVSIQKIQTVMKISDKSINHFLTNKVTEKIQVINKNKEKILCNHCMRTLSNGIRCMGICVSDNDYWIIKVKYLLKLLIIISSYLFLVLYLRWYLLDNIPQ